MGGCSPTRKTTHILRAPSRPLEPRQAEGASRWVRNHFRKVGELRFKREKERRRKRRRKSRTSSNPGETGVSRDSVHLSAVQGQVFPWRGVPPTRQGVCPRHRVPDKPGAVSTLEGCLKALPLHPGPLSVVSKPWAPPRPEASQRPGVGGGGRPPQWFSEYPLHTALRAPSLFQLASPVLGVVCCPVR